VSSPFNPKCDLILVASGSLEFLSILFSLHFYLLAHESYRELGVPAQNSRNRIIRFWKLDPLVLSIPVAVKSAGGIDGGSSSLAKQSLTRGLAGTTAYSMSCNGGY
jgi:hypothetical protein